MSCLVVLVLPRPTFGVIFFFVSVLASVMLLGQEIAGHALGLVVVFFLGVRYLLWSDSVGLGLLDMHCCSGDNVHVCFPFH